MKRITAKLSRGTIANALGASGLISLVSAAWQWSTIAGFGALGAACLVAGWAVDE